MILFQDVFTLVFKPFLSASWRTTAMMQLTMQNLLRKFIVCHSDNMAHPHEMALSKYGLNMDSILRSVGSVINSVVEVVLPCYTEGSSESVCGKPLAPSYVVCTKSTSQPHKEVLAHTLVHCSLGCGFKVMAVENNPAVQKPQGPCLS